MEQIIRDTIEIELQTNTNREDGLCLSQSWKSLINSIKGHGNPTPKEQDSQLSFSGQEQTPVSTFFPGLPIRNLWASSH
jgi:hypothetical protein